jgi:uncharacterized membrane protein YedE/YeeE
MNMLASALGAGFLFGIGLWVSGMANPKKVLGFLDVTGDWDASLMLVMGGAVAVTLVGFRIFRTRLLMPAFKDIDLPLVAGAAIFGAGWGIAGYCPGPAITALATLSTESVVFVAAMIAGGVLHRVLDARTRRAAPGP